MGSKAGWVYLSFVLSILSSSVPAQSYRFEEEHLGSYRGGGRTRVSGPHAAWVVRDADGYWAVVDGEAGPRYDTIRGLILSPDGQHVAYTAQKGGKWMVVVDGAEGPACSGIDEDTLIFSHDGTRVAYAARHPNQDGAQTPHGRVWRVVVDGPEMAPEVQPGKYERIGIIAFSRDGKRMAFSATDLAPVKLLYWRIVVDGVERRGSSGEVTEILFSPNSAHVAYVCEELSGPDHVLLLDDEPVGTYSAIRPHSLLFSPNSERLACVARRAGVEYCVVVDGQEGPEYDLVTRPVFSRDGRRLAYAAARGPREDRKWCVVLDGEESPEYEEVRDLVFSPDGSHIAYAACKGERERPVGIVGDFDTQRWAVVVDGQEGPEYGEIVKGTPVFSPDGRRLAYAAVRNVRMTPASGPDYYRRRSVVVVDGEESAPYVSVRGGSLVFSPDSQRLAYIVRKEARDVCVIDGEVGPPYHQILASRPAPHSREGLTRLRFADDGALEYIAVRVNEVYCVRHVPVAG